MTPLDIREVNQYSPLTLAFLGDSVYEQLVREKLVLFANMPAGKLHSLAVKLVCCEFQSNAYDLIAPMLTEAEESVFKRGRNSKGITAPRHSNVTTYRRATGLEALFGYLYLLGETERIGELFEKIFETVEIQSLQ